MSFEYPLSQRAQGISPSATLAITAKAKELKAQGADLVNFGAGEPDFNTPPFICEAAKQAIDLAKTKYTAVGGTPELKEAIVQKLQRDNGLHYHTKQVIVSSGAKHSLYNIFMSTLDADSEVIVPVPYWVSYPDQIALAQARPVFVSCAFKDRYLLQAEALERAITPKTRLLVLNAPSNPTGALYTRPELQALLEVLERHPQVMVVSDDIYEHIIYDDSTFYNLAMLSPELKERTFIVNGVSKAYSMTGWRIGYCAGPEKFIRAMEKIQGQCTSNPTSIAQAAAYAALTGDQSTLLETRAIFQKRRDIACKLIQQMKGKNTGASLYAQIPEGAFYIFPMLSKLYESPRFQDDFQSYADKATSESYSQYFCRYLLEHYQVAIVPGIAFGEDQAVRISYATSEEQIQKGFQRLGECVADLA